MTTVFIASPQTTRMRELADLCIPYLIARGTRVLSETDVASDPWNAQALALIRQADVVLVFFDHTTTSAGVEVGYALGAQKQVVLVADSLTPIPTILADVQIISITPDPEELVSKIERTLSQLPTSKSQPEWTSGNILEIAKICRAGPDVLEHITSERFETFVKDAFEALGYNPALPPIDFDVDLILSNFEGPHRVAVEIKKWGRSKRIPVGVVQQFAGSLFGRDVEFGLLLSTAEFTDSAKDFALRTQGKVRLWNLEELADRLERDPKVAKALASQTELSDSRSKAKQTGALAAPKHVVEEAEFRLRAVNRDIERASHMGAIAPLVGFAMFPLLIPLVAHGGYFSYIKALRSYRDKLQSVIDGQRDTLPEVPWWKLDR